jgi:hypothetical protein
VKTSGGPAPSLTKWILVPKPPRERPSAGHTAPADPLFTGSSGHAAGPYRGAVDAPQIQVNSFLGIQPEAQAIQDYVGQPFTPSSGQALIDGLPGAVALGQVTPLRSGTQLPHQPVDHLPVIPSAPAAVATGPGHDIRNQLPLSIAQFVPPHRTSPPW